MNRDENDVQLIVAQVSCPNAAWISPHNRGKRDALVTLHNDHFLWAEDGQTVGYVRVYSAQHNEMKDLIYVPPSFVGQDLISDNLYLLRYLCPVSGKTVQQEIQRFSGRAPHPAAKVAGFAVGHVARLFVDDLIGDTLNTIRNASHSGYHDATTGHLWFDAPIKREHLSVHTVGELRRAGLLK